MDKVSGKIHFCDGSILDYHDCETIYMDNGIMFNALEGNLFVPYGSIKFIAEE